MLAELSCLTPIVGHSIRFFDLLEGNVQNNPKEGKRVTFGAFFSTWATEITSWLRKKNKEEKRRRKKRKQGRNAAESHPWLIPTPLVVHFSFVHRSFFVLHPVSASFKDLNLIYGPLEVPFIVCASSYPSSIISDIFLCLKQVSTDRSYRNLV